MEARRCTTEDSYGRASESARMDRAVDDPHKETLPSILLWALVCWLARGKDSLKEKSHTMTPEESGSAAGAGSVSANTAIMDRPGWRRCNKSRLLVMTDESSAVDAIKDDDELVAGSLLSQRSCLLLLLLL